MQCSESRVVASARALIVGVALACALSAGFTAGCLTELPRGRSCGDGWWDPEYEACDPSSDDRSYLSACRDQGWVIDATCNEQCEVEATEEDCAQCGDGVASATEACDSNDVRGATCPSGTGVVRCTDTCTLDYDLCPEVCGDGIVNGTEECEKGLSCGTDDDCNEDQVCYDLFGECVAGGGFGPNLGCGFYVTKAIGNTVTGKSYVSGSVARCTDDCFFGRNGCGFCGDGKLDGEYTDFVYPQGDAVIFPAELCDGDEARAAELDAYCEPLCVDDAINSDVVLECDFDCNGNCTDFAPPVDIIPGPDAIGCCLAKNSPCPESPAQGVPDLPCCSWLDNPEWLADKECVLEQSGQVSLVCP